MDWGSKRANEVIGVMGDDRLSVSSATFRFARYADQRWAELEQCDVVA